MARAARMRRWRLLAKVGAMSLKWTLTPFSTPFSVSYSDIFYPAEAPAALLRATADITITFDPHWQSLWSRRFADPLTVNIICLFPLQGMAPSSVEIYLSNFLGAETRMGVVILGGRAKSPEMALATSVAMIP